MIIGQIKDGIVLDHITAGRGMEIYKILGLEKLDWTGKRIIPFNTSEGSGLGKSVDRIREICKGATVEDGFALKGSQVDKQQAEIAAWAKEQLS